MSHQSPTHPVSVSGNLVDESTRLSGSLSGKQESECGASSTLELDSNALAIDPNPECKSVSRKNSRKRRCSKTRTLTPITESNPESFDDFVNRVGCKQLMAEIELHSLWKQITEKNPPVMPDFERFVATASAEMENSRTSSAVLEKILYTRRSESQEHLRRLHESLEKNMASDMSQIATEEKAKCERTRHQLEEELREKTLLLAEIRNQQIFMREKMLLLKAEEAAWKNENAKLEKERGDLERKLKTAEISKRDTEAKFKEISEKALLSRKKYERSLDNIASTASLEDQELSQKIENLRSGRRFLLDQRDINSKGFSPARCRARDNKRSSPKEGSFREAVNVKRVTAATAAGTKSSLASETLTRSIDVKTPNTEDVYEESFERSFGCVVNNSEESSNTRRKKHGTSAFRSPGEILWKVACLIQVNRNAHEKKPNWKVKMKYIPTGQSQLTYHTTDISELDNLKPTSVKFNSVVLRDPDKVFKIIFLGDSGVGKTSFMRRFCDGLFSSSFDSTVGLDYQEKEIMVENKLVLLQMWDTAGQERFQSICRQYFRRVDGIIVMYDVTSEVSFKNVRKWLETMEECSGGNTPVLLVGNKVDGNRAVQNFHGEELAREYYSMFYETSAKTGFNVSKAVVDFARFLQTKNERMPNSHTHFCNYTQRKKCC